MTTPDQTLMATLMAATAVTAIVDDRFFTDRAEQGAAAPFVVLGREDAGALQTLCAAIDNPDVTFDLRCWALKRDQAESLMDACQAACQAAGFGLAGRTAGYSDEYALHAAILKVTLE